MKAFSSSTASPMRSQRFVHELIVASRFAFVGIAATAIHMSIVWQLAGANSLPILGANLIAFLAAFGVSFTGHYIWTFSSPGRPKTAIRRFFIISGSGFVANTLLLAALVSSEWLTPRIAAVSSAALVPFFTYATSRLWGFKTGGSNVKYRPM